MRSDEERADRARLAEYINIAFTDWEAAVEPSSSPFHAYDVVATFEEGGVHRVRTLRQFYDVCAMVYGDDWEDPEGDDESADDEDDEED